jgi:hypothetical protein
MSVRLSRRTQNLEGVVSELQKSLPLAPGSSGAREAAKASKESVGPPASPLEHTGVQPSCGPVVRVGLQGVVGLRDAQRDDSDRELVVRFRVF